MTKHQYCDNHDYNDQTSTSSAQAWRWTALGGTATHTAAAGQVGVIIMMLMMAIMTAMEMVIMMMLMMMLMMASMVIKMMMAMMINAQKHCF